MKSCYLQQYGWTLRILCLANKSKTATIVHHSYVQSEKQPTITTKNTHRYRGHPFFQPRLWREQELLQLSGATEWKGSCLNHHVKTDQLFTALL